MRSRRGIELNTVRPRGRARALGAFLRGAGGAGERALLLYPPGLEFITAFLGCLYGGVVAVPGPDLSELLAPPA